MENRLRDFRFKARMSQEMLAEKSGVSRNTISALERGVAESVSSKTMLKIAEALGETIDTIFF